MPLAWCLFWMREKKEARPVWCVFKALVSYAAALGPEGCWDAGCDNVVVTEWCGRAYVTVSSERKLISWGLLRCDECCAKGVLLARRSSAVERNALERENALCWKVPPLIRQIKGAASIDMLTIWWWEKWSFHRNRFLLHPKFSGIDFG